jgi:predicted transposase YdaD
MCATGLPLMAYTLSLYRGVPYMASMHVITRMSTASMHVITRMSTAILCDMRTTLEELGHPQPATPMVTDNSTAAGIANDTVKQKRSKAIDMRFYWVRDRVRQGQFHIYWRKGALNKADYFTKYHPASHHRQIRSSYLYEPKDPNKNYFECLEDNETTTTALETTRVANLQIQKDQCEGVLLSGEPGARQTSVTRKPLPLIP